MHQRRRGGGLCYGAQKKGSDRLAARIDAVLKVLPVLPLEALADAACGRIRAQLEGAGRIIGGNDLLIAAHAVALDCTVVTDNEDEFRRVPGLLCENWLR